jgi:hypothetical protein
LEAASDPRYQYFKAKIRAVLLKPKVAAGMGEAHLLARLPQDSQSEHQVRLSCLRSDFAKEQLLQESRTLALSQENAIATSIDQQRRAIQIRLDQRRARTNSRTSSDSRDEQKEKDPGPKHPQQKQ